MTDYTDFDGAQARVTSGVVYITWTPLAIGQPCKIIMPLSRISAITLKEDGSSRVCVDNDANKGWAISCQRPKELAEFIGKHMEEICA